MVDILSLLGGAAKGEITARALKQEEEERKKTAAQQKLKNMLSMMGSGYRPYSKEQIEGGTMPEDLITSPEPIGGTRYWGQKPAKTFEQAIIDNPFLLMAMPELAEQIGGGKAESAPSNTVRMLDPDGNERDVPTNQQQEALAEGYTLKGGA